MTNQFNEVPAEACVFNASAVNFRSNGDDAASAPFELLARSAQPIDHWYWGRVVHDFAGMKARNNIPIDWNHDANEAIGFSNKRRITDEGLMLSGSIVSTRPGDRADTIIKQSAKGVPFEASIFFGGDGIKVEEVAEGMTAPVNGTQFDGPGVIIREWPLRGCAVCLHGADQNTASTLFAAAGKFSASVVPQTPKQDEPTMAEPTDKTALSAVQPESPQAVEITPEKVAPAAVDPVPVVEAEPKAFSIDEFSKIAAEFGLEIAGKVAMAGGTHADATRLALDAEKALTADLRKQLASASVSAPAPTASPAKFADGEPGKAQKKPKRMRDAFVNIKK